MIEVEKVEEVEEVEEETGEVGETVEETEETEETEGGQCMFQAPNHKNPSLHSGVSIQGYCFRLDTCTAPVYLRPQKFQFHLRVCRVRPVFLNGSFQFIHSFS